MSPWAARAAASGPSSPPATPTAPPAPPAPTPPATPPAPSHAEGGRPARPSAGGQPRAPAPVGELAQGNPADSPAYRHAEGDQPQQLIRRAELMLDAGDRLSERGLIPLGQHRGRGERGQRREPGLAAELPPGGCERQICSPLRWRPICRRCRRQTGRPASHEQTLLSISGRMTWLDWVECTALTPRSSACPGPTCRIPPAGPARTS